VVFVIVTSAVCTGAGGTATAVILGRERVSRGTSISEWWVFLLFDGRSCFASRFYLVDWEQCAVSLDLNDGRKKI